MALGLSSILESFLFTGVTAHSPFLADGLGQLQGRCNTCFFRIYVLHSSEKGSINCYEDSATRKRGNCWRRCIHKPVEHLTCPEYRGFLIGKQSEPQYQNSLIRGEAPSCSRFSIRTSNHTQYAMKRPS